MKKKLVVGIVRESEDKGERRAPLTPRDVKWLVKHGIHVEVQSSTIRIFEDSEYRQFGGRVVKNFKKASLLVGIKELKEEKLLRNKVYLSFSHTIKGQPQNMPLLKEFLKKKSTLIDYEAVVDAYGKRLVYFGRFSGICGMVDSLYYYGQKLRYEGIETPFLHIKPAHGYGSLKSLKADFRRLNRLIKTKGFDVKISPFVIGITGHGNVSRGVQEILELLYPEEIHPHNMASFIRHQKYVNNTIYERVFLKEEKLRRKQGSGFYPDEYLNYPRRYESNLDLFLPYLNMLIHASYWDRKYPRMVTKSMISRLNKERFRLEFIGDISCDIDGGIGLTNKHSIIDNPTYTYDPKKNEYFDGYMHPGITILARDNLPTELPRDASEYFGRVIRNYIIQIAIQGSKHVVNENNLPREIRDAVITGGGKLTNNFKYLKRYI